MTAPYSQAPTGQQPLSLSEFLSFLFDGLEGYIYAPFLNRETGEFKQVFVKTSSRARLEQHIRDSTKTTDVYIAPAVFSEPKVSKSTFAASNVAWCEFDGNDPGRDIKVPPSIRIQSSVNGHTHCYWKLDEPVTEFSVLEQINRGLAFSLNADKSGWDCTQILRPPETLNYKRNAIVFPLEHNYTRYNIGDFAVFDAPPQISEESINLGEVPDVMDVIYKHAFPEDFRQVFSSKPEDGMRSTFMVRVAYFAAEVGCSNEEIFALIYNYDERVGKYTTRQDRTRRLLDIIERVRIKYPLESEAPSDSDFDTIEVYDIISFGNQVLEVEWFIPSLLQQSGNMLLCGPPGVGKTQVALNFAYGLATGTDVLDFSIEKPKRVLFISCEMGPVDLKVFTDQITAQFSDDPEAIALLSENFYVFPTGEPMYLNTKPGQEQLMRMADVLRIDGFIFDSLGSATNKALIDEESTKGLLDFNDRLRKEMGIFSWYIHHNRKATETNKEPSDLADVYGSQYITARATTILSLWPVGGKLLKVRELKKRLAPQEDDWYLKREKHNLRFRRATAEEILQLNSKESKTNGTGQGRGNRNPFGI